jgi:hypothetical protein
MSLNFASTPLSGGQVRELLDFPAGFRSFEGFASRPAHILIAEEYERRIHARRATAMFTLGGVAAFPLGGCG